MECLHGSIGVYGKVAYVPQQAWMQNQSVRENILFGKAFESERYTKVMNSCALYLDMNILLHGDKTEIGEKVTFLMFNLFINFRELIFRVDKNLELVWLELYIKI